MRKGSALLPVIIFSSLLMILAVFATKMVYNSYAGEGWLLQREQAFWLAEGGLEFAKLKLTKNPGWYTDLPHLPDDDGKWVKNTAVGEIQSWGEGRFKLVREKGKNRVYSVGARKKAVVVLRVEFTLFPVRIINWEEI